MNKKLITILIIFVNSSIYAINKPDTGKIVIYKLFPAAEYYLDSLAEHGFTYNNSYAVIRQRVFEGRSTPLVYSVQLCMDRGIRPMDDMMGVIKKSNRFLKIGTNMIPVVFQEIDQAFLMEFKTEALSDIMIFPQFRDVWKTFVFDFYRKKFKEEDFKEW